MESNPLKSIYSEVWISEFAKDWEAANPGFPKEFFIQQVLETDWDSLELKARMDRLAHYLSEIYESKQKLAVDHLKQTVNLLRKKGIPNFNFPYMFLNDFVSNLFLEDFRKSMSVLEWLTVFSSAEFTIRKYYLNSFQDTFKQMLQWSSHKEAFVRRLSSEGSRPMLPWGVGVPELKKNPKLHLPILESLWNDPNEIVRRSVSNHLNDVSKLDPDFVWKFCKKRLGQSKILDQNLKHALRTILKKGHTPALNAFQIQTNWKPKVFEFSVQPKKIRIGDSLLLKVTLTSSLKQKVKFRLEYKIHFRLKNGNFGEKVFQWTEREILDGETLNLEKKHSFRRITTRTFYPGRHKVEVLLNGVAFFGRYFQLEE